MNCATATYLDPTTSPDTRPQYAKGDRICFTLRVNFPGTVQTRNPVVTDFLPPGVTYEAGSQVATAANTVAISFNEAAAAAARPTRRGCSGTGAPNRFVGLGRGLRGALLGDRPDRLRRPGALRGAGQPDEDARGVDCRRRLLAARPGRFQDPGGSPAGDHQGRRRHRCAVLQRAQRRQRPGARGHRGAVPARPPQHRLDPRAVDPGPRRPPRRHHLCQRLGHQQRRLPARRATAGSPRRSSCGTSRPAT